ncbi:MAG: CDP-glycerol glycerophosphotransferase family protein [Nocardioidaceae bacterium]
MTEQSSADQNRIRRQMAGLRRGVRRVRDRSPLGRLVRPTVSVILPIYNVEAYLGECLDSIAAQTYGNYEVVVVDDGSPDGSRAIAERRAKLDPRIKVVERPNGGLGAARNTGVRHARGEFLTFVDSDDVLTPNALQVLVDSARESGSDIVVGAVRRFSTTGSWRPGWVDRVHMLRRSGIRIEEFLPLIRNLYTWNKLFRHDFWTEQGLWFREGVAYEDQPIITQLYARARGIDVIPDVVYEYRARDDLSSISQQTSTLTDLRDRVAAWHLSKETLLGEAPRAVYDGWLQTLFDAHFHWYLTSAGTVDDTYWAELRQAVVEMTADAPQALWDATTPFRRVLLALTLADRRADAQELVRQDGAKADRWPSTCREDGILLHLPFHDDPDLDQSLFVLRPEQLEVAHAVENLHWEDGADGTASLEGWAFVPKVDLANHDQRVSVVLRSASTGDEKVFPAGSAPRTAFPAPRDDTWCDYAPGSFRASVPVADVVTVDDPEWAVLLRVEVAGFTVTSRVTHLVRSGSAGLVPTATLPGGDRLVPDWRVHEPLRFRLQPLALQVDQVTVTGRTVTGSVTGPAVADVRRIVAVCEGARAQARLSGRGEVRTFRLDLPAAPGLAPETPRQWGVSAITIDDLPVGLTLVGDVPRPVVGPSGVLAAESTRTGDLAVAEWTVGALAESLGASADGVLSVGGRVLGAGVTSVVLKTKHKKTRSQGSETAVAADGTFVAELPLLHEVYRFGRLPLPTGEHDFTLLVRRSSAPDVEVPLTIAARLNGELPVRVETDVHEGRVVRGPDGVVRLTLQRPIGDARGRYQQQRLRQALPGTRGLTRGVLMRSYFGEHATDNGVSIQKELQRRGSDLPVYWAVQDHSIPVPEGGIPVIVNSREFYDLLGSVSYYIDNMYQPEYHRKPDGQVLVQTFHGYPFKQMGHPHWRNVQFSQARIDAYDARARDWDYVVSPARYATPLLARDFAYSGQMLEIGYPRNDVLLSDEAPAIREQTRASLGIEDGQVAVLYAPTFRDYLAKDDNKATMADFFDFRAATRALGDEFVVLVRGHAFNARSRQRIGQMKGTVDVTDYPEVSDLYLAADAGIVDYSSLRFDFGVTGKPMIFHVPDLQRYKDTRGWLFDFEPTAPGPLVDTTAEVVEQLLDLDGVRSRHAAAYQAFHDDYLDLEDGHAGRRFVDAVMAPRGDA